MKRKINVCFVAPISDNAGGIAVWLKRVLAFCENKAIAFHCINTLPANGAQIRRTIFDRFVKSFFRIFFQKKEFVRIANEKESLILHIATSGSFGFYRDYKLLKEAKKRGFSTILHLHFGRMNEILKSKWNIEYKLFKKCSKYVDCFIAIDESTYNVMRDTYNTVLINNPIEEHDYDFSPSSQKFIFVGRCTKEKGFFELAKVFSDLNTIPLTVVGEYKQSVYKRYKNISNITFCGKLSHNDTLKSIASSSCLILPSYTEGMPNVILEAMSFGVPCIGSNVGNIPAMIEKCGIIINPRNTEELSNAILKMNDQKFRLECSKNSYIKAKTEYSLEIIGEQLISLWDKMQ